MGVDRVCKLHTLNLTAQLFLSRLPVQVHHLARGAVAWPFS